jgi:aminoglycoside phosphotransferase (APT) family kinase protein
MTRPAWHSPPDARARAWVEAAVGGGWRVTRVRRLTGGIATAADAVTLARAESAGHGPVRRDVVLRRWLRPGWEADDQAFGPGREAAVLRLLEPAGLPVPQVIAVDTDGSGCGAPALLADRLPGARPTLAHQRRPAVLRALGETLAAIHAIHPDGGPREAAGVFAPYYALDLDRTPPRTTRAGIWARARELVSIGPVPGGREAFLHRDFHPGNTLWAGTRMTGIVDWTGASFGPVGADLGHLRSNLGVDHGIGAADAALAAYVAASRSTPVDQAWWDVRMLLDGYDDPLAIGPGRLDAMEAYLDAVIARG